MGKERKMVSRKQRRSLFGIKTDAAALWLAHGILIIPGHGIPCPRCKRPTQIREHAAITRKHLNQPYYYRRWFRCVHGDCPTKSIMVDEFKVYNKAQPPSRPKIQPPSQPRAYGRCRPVLWTED